MSLKKCNFQTWIVILLVVLPVGLQVCAQQVENLMDLSLEELLNLQVTVASRTAMTQQESPGIISVITEEEIMNSGEKNPALLANYLIDKNGSLIIAGNDSVLYDKINKNEIIDLVKESEKGQQEITVNGRVIMIDFASIPTLSWYYIEFIDKEAYLRGN